MKTVLNVVEEGIPRLFPSGSTDHTPDLLFDLQEATPNFAWWLRETEVKPIQSRDVRASWLVSRR